MKGNEDLLDNASPDDFDTPKDKNSKDSNIERLINNNKISLAFLLVGAVLVGLGLFYTKIQNNKEDQKVVLLEDAEKENASTSVIVEIAGAVKKPGVYEFTGTSRIDDLLLKSEGLSDDADFEWVEKHVNRAALLSDGQKLYIPKLDEQSKDETANSDILYQNDASVLGDEGSTIVNINTATRSELEELWGIGPVYAQKIIEQRPYSSVIELVEKGVIKSNVYERNKDLITVY
ncbi:helix-hairpin-helix domain-containing protein [Candidatus Woesebacteria bacterium]|nr:helix-hairpin-helix domain-containing protein [Candidatus Woesebacteria bacterium]